MSTTMNHNGNIKAVFIHQQINPIIGIPTYDKISLLQHETNTHNTTVYSDRVNGTIGIIWASILATKYSTISGVVSFNISFHMGNFTTPNGIVITVPTAVQISDPRCTHTEKLEEFHTCEDTKKAYIYLIMQAAEKIYLRRLERRPYGFETNTCLKFIKQFNNNYFNISPG